MRYLHTPRLPEEVRILQASGTYTKWLPQTAKIDVLILDDWGLVCLDVPTRQALMELLDDRCAARATVITSQLPVEHWDAWISEPAMADAMMDRLLQNTQRIVLTGESLRTTKSGNQAPQP